MGCNRLYALLLLEMVFSYGFQGLIATTKISSDAPLLAPMDFRFGCLTNARLPFHQTTNNEHST